MQIRIDIDQEAPPAVFRLIYRSEMTIEGEAQAVADEIRRILTWSREWNRRAGISGALLFNLSGFAQVLEGSPEAVKTLFGHIACDMRHKNLTLLSHGLVEKREFGTWFMGYSDIIGEPAAKTAQGFSLESATDGEEIISLLRSLLNEQRAH